MSAPRGAIVAWQENGTITYGVAQGHNKAGHTYVRPFKDLGKLYTVPTRIVVLFTRDDLLAGLQQKLALLESQATTDPASSAA